MNDTGRQNPRHRLAVILVVLLGLIGAVVVGRYSVDYPELTVALALTVLAMVAFVSWVISGHSPSERYRWVPFAWVGLLLITDLQLDPQDPLAVATGNITIFHVIEVLTYAAVVALVMRAGAGGTGVRRTRTPKGLLLTWPAVAVASTLWSLTPVYTLVRSLQIVILALFALLLVRLWVYDPAVGQLIWARTLRLFVQSVTILALVGFLVRDWPGDRFTWPASDPGLAATYMGCALLILVGGGRALTGFRPWAYWLRLGIFTLALTLGPTRSVLAGVGIGVGAALWFRGRERPIARYLGMTYYLAGLVLLGAAATQVATYLSRGESGESLASLSGRIPLWEFALRQFESIPEWLGGFGYGAAKILLYPSVPWAGTAHSSWMELLLGVGLIGVFLAAADIVHVGVLSIRSDPFGSSNVVALSVLSFLLIVSPVSETMVVPGIGFTMLALIHVPALAQRRGWLARPRVGRRPREGSAVSR